MTTRSILEPIVIKSAGAIKNLQAVLSGEIMAIDNLQLDQPVKYDGYNFRVTGFRAPDTVYIKPIGIAKKVYRGEIAVKAGEIEL